MLYIVTRGHKQVFIFVTRTNFISSGAVLIIETVKFKLDFTTKIAIILILRFNENIGFNTRHHYYSIAGAYCMSTLTTCTV